MKKVTLLALFTSLIVSSFVTANEVNIFNARHYKADNELYSKFTEKASKAGVDGLIVVDLPPEESSKLQEALKLHEIDQMNSPQ